MGIMVYSLLWVMQDFVHQPLRPGAASGELPPETGPRCPVSAADFARPYARSSTCLCLAFMGAEGRWNLESCIHNGHPGLRNIIINSSSPYFGLGV